VRYRSSAMIDGHSFELFRRKHFTRQLHYS
jgi:hypothetical protein